MFDCDFNWVVLIIELIAYFIFSPPEGSQEVVDHLK